MIFVGHFSLLLPHRCSVVSDAPLIPSPLSVTVIIFLLYDRQEEEAHVYVCVSLTEQHNPCVFEEAKLLNKHQEQEAREGRVEMMNGCEACNT